MRKVLLVMISLLFLSGCAITNKYEAYYGRVVDAETKEPLEGAAVLVVYSTEQYGLAGSVGHFADAQETVTDKNGEFRIPPIRITTFRPLSGWRHYTQVRIFKPGYGCYPWHKGVRPQFDYESLPPDQYVTIDLPKLETKEERLRNYRWGYPSTSVPKTNYRRLLRLINQEAVSLGLMPDAEP